MDELKAKLTSPPILGYPDFERPFIVETDASFDGLGAVLSQEQEHGRVVICYASRSLRPVERNMNNYSSMKLELLALKWAITEKFRDHLLGSEFIVYTDNNPLSYLNSAKLGPTELRWASQLAQFNFTLRYRSGKANSNADALSRQHGSSEVEETLQDLTKSTAVCAAHTRVAYARTLAVADVNSHSPATTETLPGYPTEELAKQQRDDPLLQRFLKFWRDGVKPQSKALHSRDIRALVRRWDRIKEKDGVLYVKTQDPVKGERHQLLLPVSLQPTILEALHSQAGHQGRERALALIMQRFYWPGVATDVEKWCSRCERCMVAKAPVPKIRPPMGSLLARHPLEVLAIDFTMLEKATDGREMVLVMTDVFSMFT